MSTESTLGRRDLVWLYVANVVVLVASLAAYRLAGRMLGESGFAEYALSRRTVSFLSPALLLGFGVGLPRFIARCSDQDGGKEGRALFWNAFLQVAGLHLVVGMVMVLGAGFFGGLFFGDRQLAPLVFPVLVLLCGLSWHTLLKSYYRGVFRFRTASLLDMIDLGVIPVGVFAAFGNDLVQVLLVTGSAILVVCAAFTVALGFPDRWQSVLGRRVSRELLAYSLPRVPGDFALGGLLAIPSMVAAHLVGTRDAGFVAFGSTLLALGATAVAPISTAMLPVASRRIHRRQWAELRRDIVKVAWFSGGLGLVGVTAALLLMPWIVQWYLGPEFLEGVTVLRWISVCALPYVMFFSLRSFLDAAHEKAINSRNLMLALLAFGVTTAVMVGLGDTSLKPVLVGTVAGHYLLGLLTVIGILKVADGGER